jgi:hypothetical protein
MLTAGVSMATSLAAQEEAELRSKAPGFRTDLGAYFAIGGHSCVGGGADFTECQGNGVGWSMRGGFAFGLQVRPYRFFSIAMDLSLMYLSPYKDSEFDDYYKRNIDLSVGPVFTSHIPVRVKNVLIEPTIGLKLGFVNGFMPIKEGAKIYRPESIGTGESYKEGWGVVEEEPENPRYFKQFGPEVTGIFGLDVYVLPGFGFGVEMRLIATMYQQTCEIYANDSLCRGMHDDLEDEATEVEKTPFKIFYGLRLMKYF